MLTVAAEEKGQLTIIKVSYPELHCIQSVRLLFYCFSLKFKCAFVVRQDGADQVKMFVRFFFNMLVYVFPLSL